MKCKNKQRGLIGMNFGIALDAVSLWNVGPFRRILYRDMDGKCRKLGPIWMEWQKRFRYKTTEGNETS